GEVARVAGRLAGIEDPYLRERAIDVRDIGRRVLDQLVARAPEAVLPLPEGSVVIATELLPSETLDLDRAHVVGIVTELGGPTSHAAILAQALGIPAVSGIADAANAIPEGTWVLVDGERGEVTIAPSRERARTFGRVHDRYDRANDRAIAAEGVPCETSDGERIVLRANLGRALDVRGVRRHNLEGVGLLRTEFLFLDAHEPPSREAQSEIYGGVLRACPGSPVTIRTLDFGGDKVPPFLAPQVDRNPSLGLRGLRFSLSERALFDTQLRAIAESAREGDVRVLFPMVMGASDLEAARERLDRALAGQGGPGRRVSVGAMVETPAAVFAIEDILELVDFVTLGTNDLVQFTLAADRTLVDATDECSIAHPSVLRAIARVIEASRLRGRPVSVCGEAAGDPALACLLVGLGVRELSMSPARAARIRFALRSVRAEEAAEVAASALRCRGPREVRERLRDLAFAKPGSDAGKGDPPNGALPGAQHRRS
ncbi:MAG: phosphoenolpyruvate--protein phosphotransferase, partial [Planctomycetota bacterium]